jgi:hypothetical protein
MRMSDRDYILSEPIKVTKHYWIRKELGFMGEQWTVYRCFGDFEANYFNFITAPEEKQEAIEICKMLQNASERNKPTSDDSIYISLLIACAFAWIVMMALPVIVCT